MDIWTWRVWGRSWRCCLTSACVLAPRHVTVHTPSSSSFSSVTSVASRESIVGKRVLMTWLSFGVALSTEFNLGVVIVPDEKMHHLIPAFHIQFY